MAGGLRGPDPLGGKAGTGRSSQSPPRKRAPGEQGGYENSQEDDGPWVLSILLVPYMVGSALKDQLQAVEDDMAALLG